MRREITLVFGQSWTTSKETARDFATGIAFGPAVPGIIMSKSFKIGVANPNPHT